MQKLTELEDSISKLSDAEYLEFRQWFWEYENERWDAEIKKDVAAKKLDAFAEQAVRDFKQGKYRPL
jgi:hypothetical protein